MARVSERKTPLAELCLESAVVDTVLLQDEKWMGKKMSVRQLFLAALLLAISSWSAYGQDLDVSHKSPSHANVSGLPVAAQRSISVALGGDDSRYWVAAAAGGFHAENPEHALGVDFTPQGVEVRSDTACWRMALRGYGYGDALLSMSSAAPQASANRIEYRRGTMTEWYLNGPVGVEQGFTVAEPPGQANGRPLTVALALSGDFAATLEPGGTGLRLTRRDGPALRYGGLSAYDATGRELRTWLELQGKRGLLLHVEDTGAHYPLVIDPWVQQAKLTASDGAAGDHFGHWIAISGNTVVVGSPNAQIGANTFQGAAYVFVRPATGWTTTSTFNAKLTASDGTANDSFGLSVAISHNAVVVGAPGAHAVYVFVKPGTGWATTSTFEAKLTALDGASGDGFSGSVAISSDTVVIGANGATIGSNTLQGAAYVFVKPGTGWATTSTFEAKLTALDGAAGDLFGDSVAIRGDTVVASAPAATIGSNAHQGAAYVFVKPATGWVTTSTFNAKLTASDGAAGDLFGGLGKQFPKVAVSGDTVVVGTPSAKIGANPNQGAAYVFVKPGTGWVTTSTFNAKLTASDGAAGDLFADSVAISGDTVVSGNSVFGPGAVYVFDKPATGWATTSTFDAKLTASDGTPGNAFGTCAISGDTVAVGAEFANGPIVFQGAAYVFAFFVPFSDFSADVDAHAGPPPSFDLKGSFTLGAASRGIHLSIEPVTLQVGTFSTTIPAGSFKRKGNGNFQFEGTIDGVTLDVKIEPLGDKSFRIIAKGEGVDLTGLANPVTVALTIGNDGGTTTVTVESQ
jgi:hypothetical protein